MVLLAVVVVVVTCVCCLRPKQGKLGQTALHHGDVRQNYIMVMSQSFVLVSGSALKARHT